MTEAEWNACADPQPMLELLRGKASDRKLRLFAVSCCRSIGHLAREYGDAIDAVEVAAEAGAESPHFTTFSHPSPVVSMGHRSGIMAAIHTSANAAGFAAKALSNSDNYFYQASLVRCIFGTPFHLITIDPAWNNGTVRHLAQAIYDERAFDRMPILADALEDAGCTNQEILAHCRGPGPPHERLLAGGFAVGEGVTAHDGRGVADL